MGGDDVKINDADFGPLAYDDDLEAWTGRLRTPGFARCAIRWRLGPGGDLREWPADDEDDAGSPQRLEIAVADGGKGTGPGPTQRAALAAFRTREAQVCAAVLAEVARLARECYVIDRQLPAEAGALTSQRDLGRPPVHPRRRARVARPPRLDFHASGEGGVAYTSFNFNAGFDPEHGVAVLMLGDAVREVGGSSEFYDR
jgi:hypothetical protein